MNHKQMFNLLLEERQEEGGDESLDNAIATLLLAMIKVIAFTKPTVDMDKFISDMCLQCWEVINSDRLDAGLNPYNFLKQKVYWSKLNHVNKHNKNHNHVVYNPEKDLALSVLSPILEYSIDNLLDQFNNGNITVDDDIKRIIIDVVKSIIPESKQYRTYYWSPIVKAVHGELLNDNIHIEAHILHYAHKYYNLRNRNK